MKSHTIVLVDVCIKLTIGFATCIIAVQVLNAMKLELGLLSHMHVVIQACCLLVRLHVDMFMLAYI